MSITEFRELAQGGQAVLVGLAAIAASLWAIYRFKALSELEKAKVEIDGLKNQLMQRGVINLNLDVSEPVLDRAQRWLINFTLLLDNVGSRPEVIDFEKSIVSICKVEVDENLAEKLVQYRIIEMKGVREGLLSSSIFPGQHVKYEYSVLVPESGNYLIEATLKGTPTTVSEQAEEHSKVQEIKSLAWAVQNYIYIPDIAANKLI